MNFLPTSVALTLVLAINAAAAVPFPDALAAADVRITGIKPGNARDNLAAGPVVGNGQMNAIVYVAGKDLMLRVSKNDVWDGRIDTSEDPELPKVDPATHVLHREKPGNPPSWNKPYPCGVPCADIKLAGLDGETGWTMELSLATAVATVTTSAETTSVRALAQSNVFLLRSRRNLELVGVPQKFLPEATRGTADGVAWLCQRIPGDEDAKGMDVYLAAGARGHCLAVAIVTSNDAAEPLRKAVALVREVLDRPEEEVVRAHEAVWTEFWSRSGVRLGERRFQNWWYRMVYYFRCFSKKGATAVGLKTSFDGLAGWHNSYKFNYNIQQTFLSAGPINHPELVEPIIDVLANYWPRARWFARTCFVGCEGAFVHSDVFHPHEPDPAVCKSKNRRQFAYIPWGYTLGMQGHIAFLMWEYYQYKPDAACLKEKTYPMIRDIALFYCSFIEKCRKDDQGKYLIGPSYFPENFYFGQDNVAYDLPYITHALKAAREAAGILKTDEALVKRIDAVLAAMPYYETVPDPNQDNQPIVTYYRGVKEFPKDDRHASMIQAVFPAGQVTRFSPPQEQALFRRTINHVGKITTHANSPVTLNVARARLGMTDEAWSNIAVDFTEHHKEKPNGLFAWKAHGNYMSEQVGVARMITELLLQSVDDTICLFPAWPPSKDAEFANLRAQGGFLVSARMTAGQIGDVTIRSTAGGNCRLLNPWPGSAVRVVQATGADVRYDSKNDIVTFPTQAGESYRFVVEAIDTSIPRTGLALWLSAEHVVVENGQITALKDRSGNGNDAVLQKDPKIATGNPEIAKHKEAGQPVLRFNGNLTGYEFKTIANIRTVFCVVSKDPAAFKQFAERFVLGGKEKESVDFHVGAHWTDTIVELGVFRHGKVWFNGFPVDPALSEFAPKLAVISFAAGRDVKATLVARDRDFPDRSWYGNIGEIVVYTRSLSDAERQAVDGHLMKKYRITPFRPVVVARESVLPGHTKPPATRAKP